MNADHPEEEDRGSLTHSANGVRERLLHTVEELDHRRHELEDMLDVKKQVREHPVPIALAAGTIVLGLVAGAGLTAFGLLTVRDRRRRERVHMLERLWRHPERAARREPRSFFGKLLEAVALGLAANVVLIPAKHYLERAVAGDPPKETHARAGVPSRARG